MSCERRLNIINNLAKTFRNVFNLDGVLTEKQLEDVIEYLGCTINIDTRQDAVIRVELIDDNFLVSVKDRNKCVYGMCLGYLVLQTQMFGADKDGKYYSGIELSYKEKEDIRLFSDCLILDECIFKKQLRKNTDSNNMVNIENIAKYFDVSKSLVVRRGERLGLIR